MDRSLCYLCGKSGADDRDHVPPKAFLDRGNYRGVPRITLPTHKACNREFSADEEYVRDLVGPAAQLLRLSGVQRVIENADRSRTRPAGAKRRREFLKKAVPVTIRSPAGLYLNRGVGIEFDRSKVNRIGEKIARGIIYYDTHTVISLGEEIGCIGIPLHNVPEERDKELKRNNRYWEGLGCDACFHDVFSDSVAVRRIYIAHPTTPKATIECKMAVILLSLFYVVEADFYLSSKRPKTLKLVIDNRYWIRKDQKIPGA
jgi:hypothetical protein